MAIIQSTVLLLEFGEFRVSYHSFPEGDCVTAALGNIERETPIVMLHSSCLFGESFHARNCECADQLNAGFQMISDNGNGVVVYEYAEGRGAGLEKKIRAIEIQRTRGMDTVEAFAAMGLKPDLRTYEVSVNALNDLGLSKSIKLATQNPNKVSALKQAGYEVLKTVPPAVEVTIHNKPELVTKKHKLGHEIDGV